MLPSIFLSPSAVHSFSLSSRPLVSIFFFYFSCVFHNRSARLSTNAIIASFPRLVMDVRYRYLQYSIFTQALLNLFIENFHSSELIVFLFCFFLCVSHQHESRYLKRLHRNAGNLHNQAQQNLPLAGNTVISALTKTTRTETYLSP